MKRINLNRREKYIVAGLACFILLLLLFKGVLSPILNKGDRLSRDLAQKTVDLKEIHALQTEYYSLQKKADLAKATLNKRSKDFSLFSFLDSLVGEIEIKGNVSYMKPSTTFQKDTNAKISTVELKLQAITMEQLSKYLYRVEYSGNNLYVKRMSISETSKQEGYIDVVLQVETIEA
jgi:general secretion pathway protein M